MTAINLTLRDALIDGAGVTAKAAATVAAFPAATAAPALDPVEASARADRAARRIAPVWPLRHFVAVNPFLGLTGERFDAATRRVEHVLGARMTMPLAWYRDMLGAGRITDTDLGLALARLGEPNDVAALRAAVAATVDSEPAAGCATVAEVIDAETGGAWAATVTAQIAKWCAAYFDEGQGAWPMPWRDESLWPAWRSVMAHDLMPAALGLPGLPVLVACLPAAPADALAALIARLGLPVAALDDYLHRALASIGGWAAWTRYRQWQQELHGGSDSAIQDLLAIRLAWDAALLDAHAPRINTAWQASLRRMAATPPAERPASRLERVLQQALEIATQRSLVARLTMHAAPPALRQGRRAVQAVFCIDVRSEVFRRQLEAVSGDVETSGFAGFFGFPIEYVPLGESIGGAQCPVLMAPKARVREGVIDAERAADDVAAGARVLRRQVARAWKSFRASAVSCFSFVEAAGIAFAPKLLSDSLRLTRPVPAPAGAALDTSLRARLGPRIDPEHEPDEGTGRYLPLKTGFAARERVDMAAAILGAMSMTSGFARLVLLAGHGSTTVNNPHASGLDCGACGGHTGEANARVAAAILNDTAVRRELARRGIEVPSDTWFVAGLHDTTTDRVTLFDTERAPASHATELAQLERWLAEAGARARLARAPLLGAAGLPAAEVHASIEARSRDWSQVRPEWGLAGNVAFIAAPRARTRGLDLGGRSFLHDYDWRSDRDFRVLELIMTAPMVVASWINLQYYGSSVDNRAFGSGNKVLHNVVGGSVGVLLGHEGDLQVGLPWQSVHDGEKLVHEPQRLNVFIAAPRDAIDDVIASHRPVRELLDHGWLHLFRIDDDVHACQRYAGGGRWETAAA